MRIEAVIICRDYSDYLAHTLVENIPHLDDIIVVTGENDNATKGVCAKNSVRCITSPVFDEKGHVFNKGAAINRGLDELKAGDDVFFLHLDADIVLPRDFRRLLQHAQLRKDCIYGADRVNVYGYEAWQALKPKINRPSHQDRWFVDPAFVHAKEVPEGIQFASRVVHQEVGWIPIGYFQLWHSQQNKRYNYTRGAASGTDVYFPAQWPRDKRVLLPDVVVWHLDSEKSQMGANWKGRKTPPFAPRPKPEAPAAIEALEDFARWPTPKDIQRELEKARKKLEEEAERIKREWDKLMEEIRRRFPPCPPSYDPK